MVLMSIASGSRAVHVRVDDLDVGERERVAQTIAGLQRITTRDESPIVFGVIVGIIGCIGAVIALVSLASHETSTVVVFVGFLASSIVGALVGFAAWTVVRSIVRQSNAQDVRECHQIFTHSPRARELVEAYCRQAPDSVSMAFGDALTPQPAIASPYVEP